MKVLIHNLGDDTRSDAFIELNNDEDDFWGILFNPQPQKTLRKLTMQFYKNPRTLRVVRAHGSRNNSIY